jgi:hypothetical protein
MKKCLFCSNPADSLEHVLPQWLHKCIYPETGGKFSVQVGRFLEGEGNRDQRKHDSLNFKARIVCVACNTGWMSQLESKVQPILKPLTGDPFPILGQSFFDQLRSDASLIALWLSKTALTTSFALPGRERLPETFAKEITRGLPPRGVWIDFAKARIPAFGAALTKTFPVINGNVFTGIKKDKGGGCFQFCLQVNYLLMRVGMSPEAEVENAAPGNLTAFRLYPEADPQVPERFEFNELNHFVHSIILRTWAGCKGEIPSQEVT